MFSTRQFVSLVDTEAKNLTVWSCKLNNDGCLQEVTQKIYAVELNDEQSLQSIGENPVQEPKCYLEDLDSQLIYDPVTMKYYFLRVVAERDGSLLIGFPYQATYSSWLPGGKRYARKLCIR